MDTSVTTDRAEVLKTTSIEDKKAEDNSASEHGITDENIPHDIQKAIEQSISFEMLTGVQRRVTPISAKIVGAIADKITSTHIDRMINSADTSDKREFIFQLVIQLRNIIIILGFIVFFIWLTYYLSKDHETLYQEIIKTIFTFLGGLGLGFGIKSYKNNKHDR